MSTTIEEQTADTDTDLDEAFKTFLENEEAFRVDDGSGDHDRYSHYVSKEDIVRSSMTGTPVRTLCGKKWTPKSNPEKYPVCPECKELFEQLPEN